MSAQKWILFDIGGVLEVVDDDTWQQQWRDRWCRIAGLEKAEFDARIEAAELPAIDVESGRAEEFWVGMAAAIGVDHETRERMRADFWDEYCGTGNTELIEYARGLDGRARTAILSNSADGAREEEERRFGFSEVFDPICYSHEQGVNKPDPRAYLLALERLGAQPEDVLFIDDHEEAAEGARAVGMRAIRHRENATTIAAIEAFLDGVSTD